MPQLSLDRLLDAIDQRPSGAVVFLHGDEEYLREAAVDQVVGRVLDAGTRDFNFDQLRGGDATPESLGSLIATPPMMAEYRVIVVRDAQGLSPKTREEVEAVVKSPPAGTILILVATIPSSSKARFYTNLKKGALTVEFPALDVSDLPGWLVDRAREDGIEMEMDAARALASAIGPQLGILVSELKKAVAYVGDARRITLEDVKAVAGYIPRADRWAWFDAVGEKNFQKAMEELPILLDSGENGVGLIIGLTSHLLKLGLLVAGGREGLDRALRPNQRWLARRLEPQARRWDALEIDDALADLLRADHLLKSAPLSQLQTMEELLLRLTERSSRASSASRRPARARA